MTEKTVLGSMLEFLADVARTPGATTANVNTAAESLCRLHGVKPAFLGYKPPGFGGEDGFPASCCVSINEEVIHGIPSDRKIQEGDVVKIDMGIEKDGQFDDGAVTVLAGRIDAKTGHILGTSATARRLVKATREALDAGVAQAKAGKTTRDIAAAIEAVAKKHGFHVIHEYGGHGIGERLHMEPHVPNEVVEGAVAAELKPGTRIAIEPMFGTNHGFTYVAKDGWTVKLRNGGLAAHFEQTVAIE